MLYIHVILVLLQFKLVHTFNDTQTLLRNLLTDHKKYIRPVNNTNETLVINIGLYLQSIQELDEVHERISYVAGLVVIWNDVGMVWDPSQYGGVNTISVSWDEVWTPDLLLVNPAKETKSLGFKWHMIRYFSNGDAYWTPGYLFETSCPVNARNYPFDTQECTTSFQSVGSLRTEIDIQAATTEVDISGYKRNSAWTLVRASVETKYILEVAQIDFTFHLKRKPGFVIINVIIPVLFLSLLNVLVFVLVPESGERVSFSITVLLSIAVFMTIVSDTLPKSSEPVPIISFKLMTDVILSSLATVVTIFNLGVFNKQESERKPNWILIVYKYVCCSRCCRDDRVCHDEVNPSQNPDNPTFTIKDNDTEKIADVRSPEPIKCTRDAHVTWKDISRMIDRISLIVFTIASLSSVIVYILLTATAVFEF